MQVALVTPQLLSGAGTRLDSAELREIAKSIETECIDVLATATSETELDLREEPAATAFWQQTVRVLRLLHTPALDLRDVAAEMYSDVVPRATRRLAGEINIFAARAFERSWERLLDLMQQCMSSVDPSALKIPSELPSSVWDDVVLRDVFLAQTYAVTIASLADRSAPWPRVIEAMCSRCYRSTTRFLQQMNAVDPRETGLMRPRYHPLRNQLYRSSEEILLAHRMAGSSGDDLRARLASARQRTPETID